MTVNLAAWSCLVGCGRQLPRQLWSPTTWVAVGTCRLAGCDHLLPYLSRWAHSGRHACDAASLRNLGAVRAGTSAVLKRRRRSVVLDRHPRGDGVLMRRPCAIALPLLLLQDDLKQELGQLRVAKVTGGAASKISKMYVSISLLVSVFTHVRALRVLALRARVVSWSRLSRLLILVVLTRPICSPRPPRPLVCFCPLLRLALPPRAVRRSASPLPACSPSFPRRSARPSGGITKTRSTCRSTCGPRRPAPSAAASPSTS